MLTISLWLIGLNAVVASAQEVLPKGVGTYRLGYRQFSTQTERYGADGSRQPLAEPLNRDLSGPELAEGSGGADLQRLARELQKYDSFSDSNDSLLNQLNLGRMQGDVSAEIDAKILSVGYGLFDTLSIFVGIPFVSVAVDAQMEFTSGVNNAAAISSRLGELAFDELRAGLARAAAINAGTIEQEITDKGYAPIGPWSHSGIGDIQAGSIYSLRSSSAPSNVGVLTLRTTVNVPTGYVEHPDLLTDVSTGKGYWGVHNAVTPKWILTPSLWLGGTAEYGYNFATTRVMRVPEAEEGLVNADRQVETQWNPGSDLGLKAQTGLQLGIWQASYALGLKRHLQDEFSGSLVGNYAKLSEDSASEQSYHELGVGLSTAQLYQTRRFPIPLTLEFTAHVPIAAENSMDERYFQLEIGSFFSTPAYRPKTQRQPARMSRL
jgi:hypothetical protein